MLGSVHAEEILGSHADVKVDILKAICLDITVYGCYPVKPIGDFEISEV